VANDPAGWAQLLARVGSADPPLIALEASGGYEAGVVLALDAAGRTPVVANPVATRRFAQSLGRRAKTDRIDAAMLAEYAARMRPTPRPVPNATARQLRALLARREAVVRMLVEEQNRAQEASALVRPQAEAVVALLTAQRRELDHLLASAVASDPAWQARVDLLDSVPGIGPLTATVLAVGLPDLGQGSAKAQAALLGVAPHPHESGRSRGRRCIGGGRAWVRHVVYEAVLTTVRCEPTFRGALPAAPGAREDAQAGDGGLHAPARRHPPRHAPRRAHLAGNPDRPRPILARCLLTPNTVTPGLSPDAAETVKRP